MIQFFVMLDHLKKQFPTHVRIPGIITKGGVRSNIVPELTEAEFSVRSTTRTELERVFARFIECGQAAALATGCRFEYEEFGNRYHEMRTNGPLAERFHQHFEALGGQVERAARKDFGSIDIGNLSHDFPCIHPRVRTCSPETGGHTVEFGDATITPFGHEQLRRSAETMALVGLDYLIDPDLRQQVRQAFESP
jgi:metal-dependent amidase/aminoacylase/carboxypeptidase family protein